MPTKRKPAGAPASGQRPVWAADKIERRRIEKLRPDPRNARKHPPAQIAQIRAAMREWGWTYPVLIRADGTLVAGHGRIEAARAEIAAGGAHFADVPCLVAPSWWTEAQIRAYVLADNRIAESATWDADLLKIELGDLKALDFKMEPIGFGKMELKRLFAEPDEDAAGPKLDGMKYQIVVECDGEEHQVDLIGRLEAMDIACRALIS